jgi:N utilization substance protein B
MSSRRDARESVMKALYARELAGGPDDSHVYMVIEPELEDDPETLEFATQLYRRTLNHIERIDGLIDEHTQNWSLHRIATVDRALLRMAIAEFLTFEEIPPKVSINEAIDIGKRYSTPSSNTFLNGVLDAVLMQLERDGRLQKSGRGLVGIEDVRQRARSSG